MSRISIVILLFGTLSSCGPGSGEVFKNATQASHSATLPSSSISDSAGALHSPKMVYFGEAISDDTDSIKLRGIGFLSVDAKTTSPFGAIEYQPVISLLESSTYFSTSSGLSYISENAGQSNLQILNADNFRSESVLSFNEKPTNMAVSTKLDWISWVNAQGNVSFISLPGKVKKSLDLAGLPAETVRSSDSGKSILVGTRSRTYIFSKWGILEDSFDGIEGALSADDKKLAVVRYAGPRAGTLDILNRENGTSVLLSSVGVLDETHHELSWNQSGSEIASWVQLPTGAKELRVFALGEKTEDKISSIEVPPSVSKGVICPTWIGSDLVFSSLNHQRLSVHRSRKGSQGWNISIFVEPAKEREAYVCPTVW
ncbi:MAG: hypothetical protein JWQ35_2665 [Bacteriovoracaceae bacterium]|nr:hypothetical protein [Bacteriovoracaceae bacterium]